GDDYRAIVLAPEQGDVFVLLWVDHHDEAYRWAEKRVIEVHPHTGALQVFQTVETTEAAMASAQAVQAAPATHAVPVPEGRFGAFSDTELTMAGVPPVLMPVIRRIYTDQDLEAVVPHLPAEAGEVLT